MYFYLAMVGFEPTPTIYIFVVKSDIYIIIFFYVHDVGILQNHLSRILCCGFPLRDDSNKRYQLHMIL